MKAIRTPRHPVTKALQERGISPMQFVKDHIGGSYQAFRHRFRNGSLKMDEIHKILFYTGKTFEELFENPYKTRKKINLNLSVPPALTPIKPKPDSVRVQPLTPEEAKKKEPDVSPAPGFQIADIYDGGVPLS